jgi:NAD(P)-dependent dehydrogenase (short-subunit alcohol dehydrogenase family)
MVRERVCIVTGGSSGIGRTIAVAMAGAGCQVVIVGRDEKRIAEALAAVQSAGGTGHSGSGHLGLALDVSRPQDMARMAEVCRTRYGRIDVLIASAGIGRTPAAVSRLPVATKDLPREEWQGVIDVNLNGVFLSNRAVLPMMIAQGEGEIINICSSTTPRGLRGRPLAQAYSASKFAIAAFTEALAGEVEDQGIRVSAIFPGPVETPLIENTMLDGPFGGRIAQDTFAVAVLAVVEANLGLHLPRPHILPMPVRAVRARPGARPGAAREARLGT